MPGFVSHTVMAYDVFNKINKKNVSLEAMLTYSLGGDLCKYAKCRYDSHHIKQDIFIDNMARYIKDNKLENNKELVGVLYGHILHYVMDDTIHPLIRKVDKTCFKNKKNHSLIEEYYDSYLTKKIFKINKKEYLKRKILNIKVNKEISKMIDYTYDMTYHTCNVSKYYRFNLLLYKILRRIYLLFNINFIERISGLKRFLIVNKDIDLYNNNHIIKYNGYLKKECDSSLDELYNESIDRAIKYINKINIK